MFRIDFDVSLEDFTERGSGREREKAEKRAIRTKLRQGCRKWFGHGSKLQA